MRSDTKSLGFTLIELLVGVTIGTLLMLLAMPSFTTFLRNSEIRSTTESLANGLRAARSEAVRRGTSVSFTLTAAGTPSWTARQVSDNSVVQAYSAQEGGVNVQVVAQPVAAASVAFNRLGRVVPVAVGTPTIQQLVIGSLAAADAHMLQIYIDGVHGIRVCDPSPLLAKAIPPDPRAC
jgi:type IV fimbrial biogenesis protein FimT